jgi:hypothetical protein
LGDAAPGRLRSGASVSATWSIFLRGRTTGALFTIWDVTRSEASAIDAAKNMVEKEIKGVKKKKRKMGAKENGEWESGADNLYTLGGAETLVIPPVSEVCRTTGK